MAPQDNDRVIEEFLGDTPRATQWRTLRRSLAERLRGLRQARLLEAQAEPGPDSETGGRLDKEIAALERQVAALETEEVVAEFVENSLHASLARSAHDARGDLE